jgi:two-component system sensor histidine kinase DesK
MRIRLLPPDPHQAWTPYAWLIYLFLFLAVPLSRHASALEWGLTAAAVAVFLVLYFAGHWMKGRQLLLVAAAIFALGAAFAPWNASSSVFMVYASIFAGRVSPPRRALLAVTAIVALTALEAWVLGLPWTFWVIGGVFTLLIGGINSHFAEVGRAARRLRESQAQVEQLVRIAERERIARDLHDVLGHTLSVIALKAELAGKLLAIAPERAAAEIGDVEQVSRDALREVRGAIAGYRSEGLPAELARARLALEAAGVRPEYFVMPLALPAAVEAALALAVREAVTNVIRHAAASTCRIGVERRGDEVVLEVADDGRGGAREGAGSGTGLAAMRERLAGVGGRVELRSADAGAESGGAGEGEAGAGGRGTRLVVTVPCGEALGVAAFGVDRAATAGVADGAATAGVAGGEATAGVGAAAAGAADVGTSADAAGAACEAAALPARASR